MKAFVDGLAGLGGRRLAVLVATGLVLLGSLLGLSYFVGTPPQVVLYSGLSLTDSANAISVLKADHIDYTLSGGGTTILVPSGSLDVARLSLATKNLPSGGSSSYALFDTSSALTGSDFLDNINETRALNGELEQTIEQIQGIKQARVNIVLPHQQPFAQNPDPAQASVLLTLDGATPLDQTSVNAILNLVASAVPGLKPSNISIADNQGDLLAQAGAPSGVNGEDDGNSDLEKTTGLQMSRAVEAMLDDAIGPGHVHVVATVTMNFDNVDQTQTTYDPNGQVAVSQQNSSDKTTSAQPQQSVSVQNNLPNPTPQSAAAANSTAQQTQTTNYDVSATIKHVVQTAPQISKLSVAVLMDGISTTDATGKNSWAPRSASQITAITALVKGAVGYDASRGDVVDVESMPFVVDTETTSAQKATLLQTIIGQGNGFFLIKLAMLSLATLIALLTVAKPVMMRIATIPAIDSADPVPSISMERAKVIASTNTAALTSAIANNQERMSAEELSFIAANSPAGQIAALVKNNPKESLATIRSWLSQEPVA